MKSGWIAMAITVGGLAGLVSGCATSEEWADWRSHPTHFASGTHATFSMRNDKAGSNPRVARTDVEAARQETWWGTAITVSPERVFQN